MHHLKDDFLAELRAAGRSSATIQQYSWHIDQFLAWLGDKRISELNHHDLRAWRAALFDRWQAPTIKTSITVIRSYLRFCHQEGLCANNLSNSLKTPRIPRKVQRTLTATEIAALLRQCNTSTPKGARDAAIISVLTDSGIRSAELRKLQISDLSLQAGQLTVTRKGGNLGLAFIGATTSKRIQHWLSLRGAQPNKTLFVSLGGLTPGQPLTSRGLRIILKKLGDAAGVPGVSPHAFRRAFALLLVEAGAPTRLIQEMGGWSDLRQVERYTRALNTAKLAHKYSSVDNLLSTSFQPPLF